MRVFLLLFFLQDLFFSRSSLDLNFQGLYFRDIICCRHRFRDQVPHRGRTLGSTKSIN